MVRFKIKDTTVEISLTFCAFFSAAAAQSPNAAMWLAMMLLHEFGHLAAMALVGAPPKMISFKMGRMTIVPGEVDLSAGDEAAVLLSGVAVNLFIAAVASIFGAWTLVNANLTIAVFNLLPASGLDGGGLLRLVVKSVLACGILSALTGTALVSLGVYTYFSRLFETNPMLIIVGAYFMLSAVRNLKTTMIQHDAVPA